MTRGVNPFFRNEQDTLDETAERTVRGRLTNISVYISTGSGKHVWRKHSKCSSVYIQCEKRETISSLYRILRDCGVLCVIGIYSLLLITYNVTIFFFLQTESG